MLEDIIGLSLQLMVLVIFLSLFGGCSYSITMYSLSVKRYREAKKKRPRFRISTFLMYVQQGATVGVGVFLLLGSNFLFDTAFEIQTRLGLTLVSSALGSSVLDIIKAKFKIRS